MNLSRDTILALQRHFLGALSTPARTWLEPLPSQPLVLAGDAIRSRAEGTLLDFGIVSSPGEERRLVRVGHRGAGCADVRIGEPPAWLMAAWLPSGGDTVSLASGEEATLELIVPHDAECEFRGAVRFHVADRVEELNVCLTARRSHPIARIDFNGSATADPFDFGIDDGPYVLTIANATSIPLIAAFSDLPDWLTFEVDRRRRSGPIAGPFFERAAPFAVHIRPQTLGAHNGSLRLQTNDPRPEMQNIELEFAACVVASRPCVRIVPPDRVRLRANQAVTVAAQLENWGRVPARTSKESVPRALSIRQAPVVPAAHDGKPGTATLPIRITPATLIPGTYTLTLSLRIDGGDPGKVDVPVELDVDPPRRGMLRPQTIAALFALLLLALLFVIVRGMS